MSRAIDAVQVLNDINSHHRPTPVSEFESGFNSGLNQAMWIICHAPTLTPPNEWVSVEDRLPDELTMVLIYSGGVYDVAGWIEDEGGKICWTRNIEPQFWRPIPKLEPPGKDNNVPTKTQNEPLTPCDVCMYSPPSSMGGKPCYICPASPPERQEDT